VKKSLAARFVAVLVLLPRVGLAQTPAADAGPLNIDTVVAEQRDQVWEARAKKNDVNINLLQLIAGAIPSLIASSLFGSASSIGSLPIEYERALSRGLSVFGLLQPTIGVVTAGRTASGLGFGIGLGARAYFSGNALQGFWLGGEGDVPISPPLGISARVESGYNFMFSTNLTLSLGGGLGLTYSTTINGFVPAGGLRIALGYAF